MPRYLVMLKEVWERVLVVEAPNEQQARGKAEYGAAISEESFTFEYYLDDETQIEIVKN